MKVQSCRARNYHPAMLRRGVITGEPGLACGRLIRIARVAEKPWDHRILIVATTERTMVRQITASVSIRQEPEHTRDQKQQAVSFSVRGRGYRRANACFGRLALGKCLEKDLLSASVHCSVSGCAAFVECGESHSA